MNKQQKFKERNPDYFKNYYKQHKEKFKERNLKRKSTRKYYYVIEIEGNKYCFTSKKSIKMQRVRVEDVNNDTTYKLIKTV